MSFFEFLTLASTYFPTQKYAVSWAMKSLTAEFGMGSGVASSLWTPRKWCVHYVYKYIIDRVILKNVKKINKAHGLLVSVS